jgi:cytochrome c-type biogenesis protein CcmE
LKAGSDMKINVLKVKEIILVVLVIIVSLLVIFAVYTNKSKFYKPSIIKYSQITVDEKIKINDIIDEYSDQDNKDIFITELKKINNLESINNESIYGKTLIIPVIKN